MSINPLVSVIIPVFNSEMYIGESIESILSQTYKNIEVIIINDGSTDDTLKTLQKYQRKDKRIRIYKNKQNMGVGYTRARGVKLAKGEYICWQDADDISLPSRVKDQVEYLDTHKGVGVVGGFVWYFGEVSDGSVWKCDEQDAKLREKIFRYSPIAQPASMFRSEVYRKNGNYDGSYEVTEDLEMLFRTGTKYKFANVQKVVLKYRQSKDSLTWARSREMEAATLDLRKKYSNNPAYNYTIKDGFFNLVQRASMVLPLNLRMFVYRLLRGDRR